MTPFSRLITANSLHKILSISLVSACAISLSGCFQSTGDFGRRKPNAIQDTILPAVGDVATWARGGDTSDMLKTDAETEYRKAAWDYLIPTRPNTVEPVPLVTTVLFVSNPSLATAALAYGGGRSTQGQDAITSLQAELQMANILPPREVVGKNDWYYYRGMEWMKLIPPQAHTEFTQNYFLALKNTPMATHETRYRRLMADMDADAMHLPRFLGLGAQVFQEDGIRAVSLQKLSTIERDKARTNVPDPRDDALQIEKDGVRAARVVEDRLTPNGYTKRVAIRADENWGIMERVEGRFVERIEAYRYALHHLVVETPSPLAIEAESLLARLESYRAQFPHRNRPGHPIYKDRERFDGRARIVK